MLPKWEDKCWGKVLHCFHNPVCAVSYLEVQAGWRCSRHYHEDRANSFVVVSGEIIVEQWNANKDLVGVDSLTSGAELTVPSLMVHRFRVVESGRVIEVYYADPAGENVCLDDIVRLDQGGRDDVQDALQLAADWKRQVARERVNGEA